PDLGPANVLWQWSPNINLEVPIPWLEEPLSFYKRDADSPIQIHAGHLVAVGVVALLTLVNWFGVQSGKVVQNTFTVAKTLGLIMLIVLGLTLALDAETMRANFAALWDGIWKTRT